MGIKVGIDLGTTFCAVAVFNKEKGQPEVIKNTEGEQITPSVIQFTEDGEILVGQEAKEAFEGGENGCAMSFKRDMGKDRVFCTFYGKDYTAIDLSAILLRHLKEDTETVIGQKIDEAVVTVPAYFYNKERKATMEAARRAGLKIRQIINEPTAAAMNYGTKHWRENAVIMVYDLGGGTFDVTLVQMKKNNHMDSLKTTGDHTLGGKDWDSRLVQIIREKILNDTGIDSESYLELKQELIRQAEMIKKKLTRAKTAQVSLLVPDYGHYSTSVTLEEFEEATKDLLARTGTLSTNLINEQGISWKDVTDILLVGGSTKMAQVPVFLQKLTGHKPISHVDPDLAVALGAAIQVNLPRPEYTVIALGGNDTAGKRNSKKAGNTTLGTVGKETYMENVLSIAQRDVVAHAMGVIAVNSEGTRYINKTIVPANQPIPVKCAEAFQFYTSPRGDNELEIYVLQGVKEPIKSEVVGKYVVNGIRHDRAKNPTHVRIMYSYDQNGMVHVQARQEDDQVDLPIREEPIPSDMSEFGKPIEKQAVIKTDSLSVIMALDVSGSMSGGPMADAQKAMCSFVDQLSNYGGDVEIGVIAVSDKSKFVQYPTSDFMKCKRSINGMVCGETGYGNSGEPFQDIYRELNNKLGRKIGIVCADGVWSYQDKAIESAQKCHNSDMEIIGIGFGSADRKFIKKISNSDISSMTFESSRELIGGFGKIAQEISGGGQSTQSGRVGNSTNVATWLAIGE